MVTGTADPERADAIFHALSAEIRRDILATVLGTEQSVSELAGRYPVSFPAVHRHVVVLERAGLVTRTRRGREQRVRGDVTALRTAHALLDRLEALWVERLERIEGLLDDSRRGASP